MMIAGPGVAKGQRCETPVSLVDIYPTMAEAVGSSLTETKDTLPGESLQTLVKTAPQERAVFSEYHAAGSSSGGFMLRKGDWKLILYVGHAPQLFDLNTDPLEEHDLSGMAETAEIQADLDRELRKIVDPEAADALAFSDQALRIQELGGADAIRAKVEIGFTPAPSN